MTDFPRLIEYAFPLKQASLDSVHEKNVRHGHISTLHIWPARRPLAACRAALIATLLPDPSAEPKPEGMHEEEWQKEVARRRRELCDKIGGTVVKRIERKRMPGGQVVEREKEETEGGILHWGREAENAETLEWFRQEIRKAYGGRAPKVLDPFAGGGAIPLEAMRLGCEATAIDINPVAWFILKCTLEYPQKLAGQKRQLPSFILKNREFMKAFFKSQGLSKAEVRRAMEKLGHLEEQPFLEGLVIEGVSLEADLAWHVRAWGQWVLDHARRDLAQFYPVYADFEPLERNRKSYEYQPMQLVPLKEDGTPDVDALNKDFTAEYLGDKGNPRWISKPTVAYLWARTVTCKNCRATIPLLKTRWLCKKDRKRVLLTMTAKPDRTGVIFCMEGDIPVKGGNAAQRREHDKRMGAGTMSRAGASCPCCPAIMTMEDIRVEGQAGHLGMQMTCVIQDGPNGKEYRSPTAAELTMLTGFVGDLSAARVAGAMETRFDPASTRSISCQLYGVGKYADLFTRRQASSLSRIGQLIRETLSVLQRQSSQQGIWPQAIGAYLCLGFNRLLAFNCVNVRWKVDAEAVVDAFARFSISLLWDFAESIPTGTAAGCLDLCLERIATALDSFAKFPSGPGPKVVQLSADELKLDVQFEVIVTDPPYYQAISYADLADFFYVWLRRIFGDGLAEFADELCPKTKEIVQHVREDKTRQDEKKKYEKKMAEAFSRAWSLLLPGGRFVVVFAHKEPDAWETLVSAMIQAGFVVTGSWPVATEMQSRQRASESASLGSSVWLVCKRRGLASLPGWDNKVLEEMRTNIAQRLRDFWDAGIRGPDFVWAATGPALEAYSKHPVVRKVNAPGRNLTVSEFLTYVRRMVVDFVVGRVLAGDHEESESAAADRLDEPTAYYLLHRHDFGLDEAPAGACILYATACGLSDQELVRDWDLLVKTGSDKETGEEQDEESEGDEELMEEAGSGSKVRLKVWNQRRGRSMGYEAPGGRPVPLIDRIHRLLHLWKGGDVHKVDEYLDEYGLRRHELFGRVLQSLIELSKVASEERSLLESLSNHIGAKGAKRHDPQRALAYAEGE
ncbi:MAG: DUF1156 domain-containing protein [Acidobacteriota bacterium]